MKVRQFGTALQSRRAVVAACLAAVIAVFPATVSAATSSWTIVPSPNSSIPAAYSSNLSDITCVGASDCWAVGRIDYVGQTLIEHNAGSGWVIVTSPYPVNSIDTSLTGVTCVTASDCWTVGSYAAPDSSGFCCDTKSVIEQYNGSSWAIVSSPDLGSDQIRLSNVKCVNASNCWAVGVDVSAGSALIEQYNGSSWAIVPNLSNAGLGDVACLSLLSDCWAVGGTSVGGTSLGCPVQSHGCTLIEHNTGNGWVVVPSPNVPTASADGLGSVTCVSASNCWAVGSYINQAGIELTLTAHYDGQGWAILSSPNVGNMGSALMDVSCASASDCWAVGWKCCTFMSHRTLIEHNTGTGWVIVKSPNGTTQGDDLLFGVKCVAGHDCWAVGSTTVPDGTLIEHHG
jgi:hypothetical protein